MTTASIDAPEVRVPQRVQRRSSRKFKKDVPSATRKWYATQCTKLRGPLSENPVKAYRLDRVLTIKQFADMMGLSEHGVIRTEQGFYPELPKNVAAELGPGSDEEYHQWKSDVRKHNYRMFGFIKGLEFPSDKHPLDVLYDEWHLTDKDDEGLGNLNSTPVGSRLNDTEVCKMLCINQSVINYWHNRPNSQKSVPVQFTEALLENGYDTLDIQLISAAYSEFRRHRKGDPVTTTSTRDYRIKQIKEALDE